MKILHNILIIFNFFSTDQLILISIFSTNLFLSPASQCHMCVLSAEKILEYLTFQLVCIATFSNKIL